MSKEILIHENQSSIFDLVDDTTTNSVSVMIKSKPPYHTDLFNVKIIPYTDRCSLALNVCGEFCYVLDFIYSLSPTSFIVYSSSTEDVVKISNTKNVAQKHYLCEDNASITNVNNHESCLEKLNQARLLSNFDEIFKILSEM